MSTLPRWPERFSEALRKIPRLVGAQAVYFFNQRFREQAWADDTTHPWKARKKGAKRDFGRAILVDRGHLRRSIKVTQASLSRVVVASTVPYAQVHNEGFDGVVNIPAHTRRKYGRVKDGRRTKKVVAATTQVKAHSRRMRMPKRQFMGNSAVLNQQIARIIQAELNRSLNK
jgi:phage gpG-like protein